MRVPTEFSFRSRADWPAALSHSAALLEGKQLLGAERLVVNLRRCFDEVLKVGAGEEVAQVDEFAVLLVFHCCLSARWLLSPCCMQRTIDDTPAVLAAADLLATNDDRLLRADNSKGHDAL